MSDKKPSSELISAQKSAAFSLWNLPSFDAPEADHPDTEETEAEAASVPDVEPEVRVEDVVAEDVKPLTLEDVEAVRQDAWNEVSVPVKKTVFMPANSKPHKKRMPCSQQKCKR